MLGGFTKDPISKVDLEAKEKLLQPLFEEEKKITGNRKVPLLHFEKHLKWNIYAKSR